MIRVDTANRLQGAEFAVTIVVHPLSGRRDATAFHLEAGRLCVLASRHRHACIVVARAGIADLLDAHPSDEPIHLGVQAKFPDGWEANHACSPTSPATGCKREIRTMTPHGVTRFRAAGRFSGRLPGCA